MMRNILFGLCVLAIVAAGVGSAESERRLGGRSDARAARGKAGGQPVKSGRSAPRDPRPGAPAPEAKPNAAPSSSKRREPLIKGTSVD
jgi:hypothetical protein